MTKKVKPLKKPKKKKETKKVADPIKKVEPPQAPKPVLKVSAKTAGYKIKNIGQNNARELKPGIGIFEIPAGGTLVVADKEIADSLVNDSQGKLILVD